MKLIGAQPVPDDVLTSYIDDGLWDEVTVRDGIEAHAAQAPQHLAVVDAASSWTYLQLRDEVNKAVGHLLGLGVGPGSVVLVIAPLIAPAVVAYHAAVRTGAVVVMLDRRSGRADVTNAVDAAAVTLILSTQELLDSLGASAIGIATLTFTDLVSWDEPSFDWDEPDASQPIAAVFTSGTTSRPKCVVHSLNTLRSGARNMAEALEVTSRDVAFLSTPLASITGLVQTHLMLDRGGVLILEDKFEPAGSLRRLRESGATILGGAPVIIEELFKQAATEGVTDLPLRVIALGGSMIPRETLELAVGRYGITPTRIYGSSEVPVATGALPADVGEARLSNDGACLRGTEIRIVGDSPGEIHVRGPMRFLGYIDQQDNEEVFTEGGWYRSGDLGTFDDGRLTIVGRLKEIVSRKGLKISLTEIDDVVRTLPGIDEAAAFGLPDEVTGERLVLAVHAHRPEAVDFDAITNYLLDAGLAKWKLPEQVVDWNASLPRTESGKVQRRLLVDGTDTHHSVFAPRLR